jgi:hypothetical protein
MARLTRTLELEVRRRAAGRCEYCLFVLSVSYSSNLLRSLMKFRFRLYSTRSEAR